MSSYLQLKKYACATAAPRQPCRAIRLARGFTGRDKVIKFAGCYHGHVDSLLVKAGSGALTLGNPDSAGVPASFAAETIVLPYNDLDSVADSLSAPDKLQPSLWNPTG